MWSWGKIWAKLGKEMGIINSFFHILQREYLLKQKIVVVQTSEWTFKANIAGNVTFVPFGSKMAKTDYFKEFHFSLSVLKAQQQIQDILQ